MALVEPEKTENRVISRGEITTTATEWALPLQVTMSGFFPEIPVTTPDALFEREKAAFKGLLPTLKQQHPGKYVAVHEGQVVVVGPTESEVVRLFFGQFGDTHVYIGYVGDTEPATYQLSPVWVLNKPSNASLPDSTAGSATDAASPSG